MFNQLYYFIKKHIEIEKMVNLRLLYDAMSFVCCMMWLRDQIRFREPLKDNIYFNNPTIKNEFKSPDEIFMINIIGQVNVILEKLNKCVKQQMQFWSIMDNSETGT